MTCKSKSKMLLNIGDLRARLGRAFLHAMRRPSTLPQAHAFIRNGTLPTLPEEEAAQALRTADNVVFVALARQVHASSSDPALLIGAPGQAWCPLQDLVRELPHIEKRPPPGGPLPMLLAWHRTSVHMGEPCSEAQALYAATVEALADPVLAVREDREVEWTARQSDPGWADRVEAEFFGGGPHEH